MANLMIPAEALLFIGPWANDAQAPDYQLQRYAVRVLAEEIDRLRGKFDEILSEANLAITQCGADADWRASLGIFCDVAEEALAGSETRVGFCAHVGCDEDPDDLGYCKDHASDLRTGGLSPDGEAPNA